MPLIPWTEQLETGQPQIDALRAELVAAMNGLWWASEAGARRGELAAAFDTLCLAAECHCAAEELYLDEIRDADWRRHAYLHQRQLQQLAAYYAAFRAGDGAIDPSFFGFLLHWVRTHLFAADAHHAVGSRV